MWKRKWFLPPPIGGCRREWRRRRTSSAASERLIQWFCKKVFLLVWKNYSAFIGITCDVVNILGKHLRTSLHRVGGRGWPRGSAAAGWGDDGGWGWCISSCGGSGGDGFGGLLGQLFGLWGQAARVSFLKKIEMVAMK